MSSPHLFAGHLGPAFLFAAIFDCACNFWNFEAVPEPSQFELQDWTSSVMAQAKQFKPL
jgi:hypothetical protein